MDVEASCTLFYNATVAATSSLVVAASYAARAVTYAHESGDVGLYSATDEALAGYKALQSSGGRTGTIDTDKGGTAAIADCVSRKDWLGS